MEIPQPFLVQTRFPRLQRSRDREIAKTQSMQNNEGVNTPLLSGRDQEITENACTLTYSFVKDPEVPMRVTICQTGESRLFPGSFLHSPN